MDDLVFRNELRNRMLSKYPKLRAQDTIDLGALLDEKTTELGWVTLLALIQVFEDMVS